MSRVFPGRYTADIEGAIVVFIIGFRINKLLAFRKWMPVASAIGPMMSTLYQNPEKGFLGGQTFAYWPGLVSMQYWRSFDDLERFAHNPADVHFPAWRRFNQAISADGTVGIFHETYLVEAGCYEAVYGNMPVFGLAATSQHVLAVGRRETARRRLGGENEPAVEAPG